ncbi:MAG: hypothetical protein R3300_07585 [Candidatus Promineifilaceae bacterium]|nr:hypothetical protein [Candidatus Promineifilaceae bacterium]
MAGLRDNNVTISGSRAGIGQVIALGLVAEELSALKPILCSDEAVRITQEWFCIDGGLTLVPDSRTLWSLA